MVVVMMLDRGMVMTLIMTLIRDMIMDITMAVVGWLTVARVV